MTADDKRWQAEDDARALAQANVVNDDPARLEKAKNAATRMAAEEKERADAMSKVARSKKKKAASEPASDKPSERSSFNVFEQI
jgi:hypothetical protein